MLAAQWTSYIGSIYALNTGSYKHCIMAWCFTIISVLIFLKVCIQKTWIFSLLLLIYTSVYKMWRSLNYGIPTFKIPLWLRSKFEAFMSRCKIQLSCIWRTPHNSCNINVFTSPKGKGICYKIMQTHQTFTCPKSTIETLEKGKKYIQS